MQFYSWIFAVKLIVAVQHSTIHLTAVMAVLRAVAEHMLQFLVVAQQSESQFGVHIGLVQFVQLSSKVFAYGRE
jgi:hypothetical protein